MQNHFPLSPKNHSPQPFNPMSLPLEFGRMMETFMSGTARLMPFGSATDLLSPVRIDVIEDESALQLVAEMPGIAVQDIDVELEGQQLRVSGQKNGAPRQDIDHVHLKERSFGRFSRTVVLPFLADVEQVSADFCNGILTVRVSKPESLQRAQHIQVRDRTRESQLSSVPNTHLEPTPDGLRPGIGARDTAEDDGQEEQEDAYGQEPDDTQADR